jgi:hypothetical protein
MTRVGPAALKCSGKPMLNKTPSVGNIQFGPRLQKKKKSLQCRYLIQSWDDSTSGQSTAGF